MSMDVAEIAGRLTTASRRALVRIHPTGWSDEGGSGPARKDAYSLWWGRDGKFGLVMSPQPYAWTGSGCKFRFALTLLGQKVRAHLLNQDTDHD